MQTIIAIMVTLLLAGCASFGGGDKSDTQPVLSRTLLDADGKKVGTVEVSFAGGLYGRGCQALTISPEGEVDYLMQQDASSDYSTVRGLVATVPETVAVAINPMTSLLNAVVISLGGALPMSGPSDIHGCDNLFEGLKSPPETPAPEPPTQAPE
jgi:hypothetical protein